MKKSESIVMKKEINSKDFDTATNPIDENLIERNDEFYYNKKISSNLKRNSVT